MFKENITAKREVKQLKQISKIQTALTCKVETNEDVKKILSHFCKACLCSSEVLEGKLMVKGKLNVNLIYLNEEDTFGKAEGSMDFTDKMEDENINITSTVAFIQMNIISSKILSVNGKEVKIEAVIETECEIINNETIELKSDNLDDVFIKTDVSEVKLLKQQITESFNAELMIKTKDEIKEVLFSKSKATVKNIEIKSGYVIVNGEICSKIVYLTNEEEPKLKISEDSASFSEEIKTNFENVDFVCDSLITICNEISEIKDREVMLKIEMNITLLVFEKDNLTSILDAYCTDKDVNLSYTTFYNETLASQENYTESISSKIPLKNSEISRVRVIDCVEKDIVVASTTSEDNYLTVEGLVTYNVLFEEYPEDLVTSQVNSIEVELPFSLKLRKQAEENTKLKVVVKFKDTNVFQAKNSEAEISSGLNIEVKVYDIENVAYVSSIDFGENKIQNENSVSLYIAKEGDDVWTISKNLNVDPEVLTEQNKTLLDEKVNAGEQIVLYRQKIRNKMN